MNTDERSGALPVEIKVPHMKFPSGSLELFLIGAVHSASQTILSVVSNLQGVVIILRLYHRQHRSKYFFLFDGRARLHVSNNGRLDEEALLTIRTTAAQDSAALALALLY